MKLQQRVADWPPHEPTLQRRWQVIGVCHHCGEPMTAVWAWTTPGGFPVHELRTWSYCRAPGDSTRRWRWRPHFETRAFKTRNVELRCPDRGCPNRPRYRKADLIRLADRHAGAAPPRYRMAV